MPHHTKHFGGRPITGEMHPVMARQPRLMAQQVAHRDPLGRDRVAQAKLGHVVAHRFGPVEPPLMVQQRDGGRGEGFGDRADHELRRRRHRQVRLRIALAISPRQRHLAILHDGEHCARHLPVGHDFGGEMIEIGDKRGNRRGGRSGRCVRHGSSSMLHHVAHDEVVVQTAGRAPFAANLAQRAEDNAGARRPHASERGEGDDLRD